MVTDYQLVRAVASLAYRRRLLEGVGELEDKVREYLTEHDISRFRLGGYDVSAENGQIRLEEAPIMDVNQLRLPLYVVHDDENDGTEKLRPR